MPWIIFTAIVWLFIIVFLGGRDIKKYWTAGIWAGLLIFFLTYTLMIKDSFIFQEHLFDLNGVPAGYLAAAVGIGIILIRFLPEEQGLQFAYLILFALGLTALEYFALTYEYIEYLEWSLTYSFFYKLIALIAITWLSNLTVKQERRFIFK